jgi:hypothetical protein
MQTITLYLASDGTRFESKEECRVYETLIPYSLALGLRPSDLSSALNGTNRPLGDVLESIGIRIARARCARGGAKRHRRPKASAEPQP